MTGADDGRPVGRRSALAGRGPWRVALPLLPLALPLVGSTGAVLLSGLVSAKIAAVLLGPEGVGRLAIAQGVVLVVAVVANLSVHEGLVRFIATRRGRGELAGLDRGRSVALGITAAVGTLVALGGLVGRHALDDLLFPGVDGTALLLGALGGGLLYAWASVLLALTTAYRRVELFALGNSLGALSTPVVGAIGFAWLGVDGVAPVVLVSNACSLGAAALAMSRLRLREQRAVARGRPDRAGRGRPDRAVARELLGFGVPQTLFHLTSLSFVLVIPLLAQRVLGTADTGLFRAAFTLSSGAGALLTFAIGQDLFPRMSAMSHRPELFTATVNQGVRLVAVGGGMVAVVGMAAAPWALRLLFTARFVSAANLFRWLLIGELLRLVTLVLTTAVSAARGTGVRLAAGLLAAGASSGATYGLVRSHGLAGAGAGSAAGHLAAVVFVVVAAWRLTPVRLDAATVSVLLAEAAVLALVFVASSADAWWASGPAGVAGLVALGLLAAPDAGALLGRRDRGRAPALVPERDPGAACVLRVGRVLPPTPPRHGLSQS